MKKKFLYRLALLLQFTFVMLLLLLPQSGDAQAAGTRKITGAVTAAATNEPMAGVSVRTKKADAGTATNADGSFSLRVNSTDKTLVLSSIGFQTLEIPIGSSDIINATLTRSSADSLNEVIVVGYGSQKKRDVTAAVVSIKPEDFNQTGARNAVDLIQGKVAGLSITRTGGSNPNTGASIQIRSATSINGTNSPLIVIDGIPGGNLDLLQQDDIASFYILKDGSAAAIYGTQANGGVIIVTTKKGRPGTTQYDYSTYFSKQYIAKSPDFMTPFQYREKVASGLYPQLTNTYVTGLYTGNTNMFDSVVNKSNLTQYHDFAMSGGGPNSTYRASIYYSDLQGVAQANKRQQFGARINMTQSGLKGRLHAQVDLVTNFNKANLFGGGQWLNALTRIPTLPIHDSVGKFFTLPLISNPISDLAQQTSTRDQSTNSADASLTLTLWRGLKAGIFGSVMRDSYNDKQYNNRLSDASLYQTYYPAGGYAYQGSSVVVDYALTPTVEYSGSFAGKHNIAAVAGYNYQYHSQSTFSSSNRGFVNDLFTSNNLGAGNGLSTAGAAGESSNRNDAKLIAFFGRINYNYLERYLFQVSFRREGSSKFGANNKWGNFPAASVGWDIARESFMSSVTWINELKLRAGYGVTGNSGINPYQSLVQLGTGGQYGYPDGTYQQTYGPSNNPNPNLKWEKKAEFNIGTDFSLLKGRISGSIDVFRRNTSDLLFNYTAQLPAYIQQNILANVGSLVGKGIELTLSASVLNKQDFNWRMDFTASTADNKMTSLSNDIFKLAYFTTNGIPGYGALGNALRVTEGGAIGNFYGKKFAGIDNLGQWLFYKADNKTQVSLGQVADNDQRIIGNALPKYYASWTNNFSYKSWNLQLFFRGRFKYQILNAIDMSYGNRAALPGNVLNNAFTTYANLKDTYAYSDYYLQPGGFVKLDNITLGYTFKPKTKLIRNLYVYVSGSNIFEITRYKGNDPDYIENTGLNAGIDGSVTPSTRQILAGLRIGF